MNQWPLPQFSLDPIGKEWLLEFIGPVHFDEICEGQNYSQFKISDCVVVNGNVAYLAIQAWARPDNAFSSHHCSEAPGKG